MKQLKQYKRNGYEFSVIRRIGKYAIAQGKCADCCDTYEIFEVLSHDGHVIAGNQIEASEYVPCDAQWGVKGWTFKTYEGSVKKYIELTQNKFDNRDGF